MRDADVRAAVRQMLAEEHAGDDDTRVVEEMGIWSGAVRIDVAVINGRLTGYELKSDRDTLERLPAQAALYNQVFDEVRLVVGSKHASKARRIVPPWWGVIVATGEGERLTLTQVRLASANPSRAPIQIARLLWREEALTALAERQLDRGYRSKSVGVLHQRLVDSLSLDELSACVRSALKRRNGWLGEPSGN